MQQEQCDFSLVRIFSETGNQMFADQESHSEVQFYFSENKDVLSV